MRFCVSVTLLLISGALSAQIVQPDFIELAEPASINAIRAAGHLNREQATAVREALIKHRVQAGTDLARFIARRQQSILAIISEEALTAYIESRLQGQVKSVSENVDYVEDSLARRRARNAPTRRSTSDETPPAQTDTSVNLLTRDTVGSLSEEGIIDAQQAQSLLVLLRSLRADRQALFERWDLEKDAIFLDLGLDERQREDLIAADRLIVTAGDLHRRQAEGAALLEAKTQPSR